MHAGASGCMHAGATGYIPAGAGGNRPAGAGGYILPAGPTPKVEDCPTHQVAIYKGRKSTSKTTKVPLAQTTANNRCAGQAPKWLYTT